MSNANRTPRRGFSFTGQVSLPGQRLDTELDRIYSAIKANAEYTSRAIGPDGRLLGPIVSEYNFDPNTLLRFQNQLEAQVQTLTDQTHAHEKAALHQATMATEAARRASSLLDDARRAASQAMASSAQTRALAQATASSAQNTSQTASRTSVQAKDAQTSANSARLSEDMAYRWAEKLDGPVYLPTNGDPVDDGFFSARWWAINAKYDTENGSFWYLGPHPTPPTEGNGGTPLQPGMWYYDTSTGETLIWNGTDWVPIASLSTTNWIATDDAGDGTINGDVDATDFTGQNANPTTFFTAEVNDGVIMYHKGQAYSYVGTRPQNIGQGGDATVLTDWAPIGVGAHSALSGLLNDDHPQYLLKSGGTMTGDLVLANDPTAALQPATKQYADVHPARTDNPHQVQYAQLLNVPATFPPSPHTHVEADITDLDKYTQAEVDASQAAQDDLIAQNATDIPLRVRWRHPYAFGNTYEANDMVRDGTWTMVANKQTLERAAPQPTNDPQPDLPDAPDWTAPAFTGVVRSGREWDITQAVEILSYDVWVPSLTAATSYVVFVYTYPTGDPDSIQFEQIAEPLLVEDQWSTVRQKSAILGPGTTVGIFVEALNSGSDTLVTGGWGRAANSNDTAVDPGVGNWGAANNGTTLRLEFTDLDSTDRKTEVMGMVAGTTVTFSDTLNATQSVTYRLTTAPTDATTHAWWAVQQTDTGPSGLPAVGATTTMTATVPVPSPTDYVVETGANPGANTRGTLELDGVPQTGVENNAYGVRIIWDVYTTSDDWDVVATSSAVGSGGGGTDPGTGTAITSGPTFPAAPANSLHYLTVNPTGLYVRYDDGDSVQWVQTNGGADRTPLQEAYHDPTFVASWRLDRTTNTLECWGRVNVSSMAAPETVVFPKAYTLPPTVTVAAEIAADPSIVAIASGSLLATQVQLGTFLATNPAIGVPTWMRWHAIGEWDGVS